MPIDDSSERVRELAYLLWERAGRPNGREHEFWAAASHEIEFKQANQNQRPNENRFVAR
ncbi:DUF2934 domain-containing protein [Antarcticirhabdus aurantiaca]|uniref:DUF2934 domain-containing protein n=1 Tax=Antarcticirhabdus aurantiaca TaxID=2606717 RepID=A0ACD4NKR2_9HYPH|nr:DUF2934 domain-containing protein [Antarcticirhabdus aurantiaca]WAJ27347.1 DUF2934 domain-containing protein [Jeongeuplla avenae]